MRLLRPTLTDRINSCCLGQQEIHHMSKFDHQYVSRETISDSNAQIVGVHEA